MVGFRGLAFCGACLLLSLDRTNSYVKQLHSEEEVQRHVHDPKHLGLGVGLGFGSSRKLGVYEIRV